MSDFQATTTPRSRKARICPACRAEIGVGQKYRREADHYDGAFYVAIMCEPCGAFMDRYVESMQCASFLNWDECTFTFGDIINEAAEYIGHESERGESLSAIRDAILPLFDDFDKEEREYRRKEAAQRREAAIRQAEYAADRLRRLNYGQSAPSPTDTRDAQRDLREVGA